MSQFERYMGIDYSGAETPNASLKGLRVYQASSDVPPREVPPPPRKYWTRRGHAEWLADMHTADAPTLVGIDHGFSFPAAYFERHGIEKSWAAFLEDFQRHWPTDEDHTYVDFIRHSAVGMGQRTGESRWRRLTELRTGRAKSVFHFDVQGSVAKSTHASIPWLNFLHNQLGSRVHISPFDGWDIPPDRSAIIEVYPALWSTQFERTELTNDQHDAYSIAASLSRADRDGTLPGFLNPRLTPAEKSLAEFEGWILGVM
jgi:hypothetical protein